MSLPPLPPESKYFNEVNGMVWFIPSKVEQGRNVIGVLPSWRFIIAAVAIEEWEQHLPETGTAFKDIDDAQVEKVYDAQCRWRTWREETASF